MNDKNIELLKKVRKKLALTQLEMGKKLDVDRNYIYMMESGRKPISDKTIRKLEMLNKESLPQSKNLDYGKLTTMEASAAYRSSADYESEIARLHTVIESMQRSLDLSQDNLTQALELLKQKNDTPVNLASGASCGGSTRLDKNKKGA